MKGCNIMFPPASEFKSSLFQKLLTLAFFSPSTFLSTILSWCGEIYCRAIKLNQKLIIFIHLMYVQEHTALNYDTFLPRDTHTH